MDQSKITTRYAKAFFSLAKEKGQLDLLKKDMDLIRSLCDESSGLKLLLESPVLKISQKIKLLDSMLEEKVQKPTLNFVRLVTHSKREAYLPGICRDFLGMYQKEKGIKTAVLTSAVPISKTMADQIHAFLEAELKLTIEMSMKTDPELIGGFVLRIDDKQVDASILNQLKKIKVTLLETDIK
jgi:F-type H+-transporting ATPase subunit delta